MKLSPFILTAASAGLLFLGACSSSSNKVTTEVPSPAPSKMASVAAPSPVPSDGHGTPQAGGQVVESGPYHLEFVPEKEAEGTHLDFYLQTGNNHQPIADAKVTAQIQLPDGTQKSLDLKYDAEGKHYTALFTSKAAGEYKVAMLSEINGEKVNGRFSFKQ